MDIEEYLAKFDKFTKDPTLEAMEYLLSKFDNPHKKLKCIHVAGTNGKGSIVEMINNCLINAGYKVGKFISPHLITFNDGICINNKEIDNKEIEEILRLLSNYIEEYNKNHEIKVKWFEVITSIALIYFYKNNCDFAVIETGMGGITDCTNVIEPLVSIIANIGYDHVDILGKTLQEIATQKAGIIKKNSETVILRQEEIMQIIEEKCKNENNKLHIIEKQDLINYKFNDEFQQFDFKKYKNIEINLKGKVQIYNASQCLETIEIIKQKGYKIPEEAIRKGLKTVIHKARMEVLNKNPLIIFDGGHNENAIKNLKENIKQYYNNKKHIYIISILKTKDYENILMQLSEDKEAIFFLTSGNDEKRYVSKEELYNKAKKYINSSNLFLESLEEAVNIAKKNYEERIIFIVGSFYIYKNIDRMRKKWK